jgi:hypothetical protein
LAMLMMWFSSELREDKIGAPWEAVSIRSQPLTADELLDDLITGDTGPDWRRSPGSPLPDRASRLRHSLPGDRDLLVAGGRVPSRRR